MKTPQSQQTPSGGSDDHHCYASFWGKILRKWDWWIYGKAHASLCRIMIDNPGMSYLIELNLRGWNEQMNISPELRRATELFHDSLMDQPHNKPSQPN